MRIVTSGSPYLDIDGYAGCVAYAEFLRASDLEARAVSTSICNNSVTPAVKSWPVQLDTTYQPNKSDSFIIIDTSSPKDLDKAVKLEKVETVIDHHPGFEDYWFRKLGNQAVIEPVGSACTLVYEAWQKANLLSTLSPEAAKLMTCGILENTLNLQAAITGSRDKKAYEELVKIVALPDDWAKGYFTDCDRGLLDDFPKALANDVKILHLKTLDKTLAIGQIAVWDSSGLINRLSRQAWFIMPSICRHWFVNFISIGEGRSYFLTSDTFVVRWLADLLGATAEATATMLPADRLWLRKEILRRDIAASTDSEA